MSLFIISTYSWIVVHYFHKGVTDKLIISHIYSFMEYFSSNHWDVSKLINVFRYEFVHLLLAAPHWLTSGHVETQSRALGFWSLMCLREAFCWYHSVSIKSSAIHVCLTLVKQLTIHKRLHCLSSQATFYFRRASPSLAGAEVNKYSVRYSLVSYKPHRSQEAMCPLRN